MKDCYYDLGLHFILLDDCSQSYILKLRDRTILYTQLRDNPNIPARFYVKSAL
jgi:hypothetical protein